MTGSPPGSRGPRRPRRVAVVGGGPAGTALALGLLSRGHDVSLVSDRSPAQVRAGNVMSSQVTFESALEALATLGVTDLLPEAPALGWFAFEQRDGDRAVRFRTDLPVPARSVDQRVVLPLLMAEVAARGGEVVVRSAGVEDLEELALGHDLVVVSTGRDGLASLFPVDPERTPYDVPQRVAALTYVQGLAPAAGGPGLRYHSVVGVGECFTTAATTVGGACDIVVVEGVPGGPLDVWDDVDEPESHLARLVKVLRAHFPAEADRLSDEVALVDAGATLRGRITPTVRRPVGTLPSGRVVLGMADAVVLNDPLTSQGANNALKSAASYLASIDGHDGDFDEQWMEQTFDNFWRGWACYATAWTNAWLQPPSPHQREVLAAAGRHMVVADRLAAGFDDARLFSPWWYDAAAAQEVLESARRAEKARFDAGDLRRALGQYATGVTIVTTVDDAGRPWGMTANSFTSVSLDPPLVLWAAARTSPSLPAFEEASHFAVNVLASDQHHLSRQFSVSGGDKFAGTRLQPDAVVPDGVAADGVARETAPVLDGTVAHFVCRRTDRVEAGDHVVFFGEVESFEAPGGEPLVFHSGFYRLATRHPDL